MAMLAAPRRKQKVINLRAKNNAWSNDSNKFGQRMLEKMGWSEGKGLGANENGIVEHVVARYKNDDKGLGFEDRNDQWTKHEDDFNSLLANLSNGDKNVEKLHSGISLEVKSKKSKARVHYHKFTRGKDLTRYSEKDLANIFGKKSLKVEDTPMETVEDVKTADQVFTDKGSMVDYFKSKLATFKLNNTVILKESTECAFQGFSGTGDDDGEHDCNQGFGMQELSSYTHEKENSSEVNPESVTKTKKKKKKRQNLEADSTYVKKEHDNSESVPKKVKKSKKKLTDSERLYSKDINTDQSSNMCEKYDCSESVLKKVKKSKKKLTDSEGLFSKDINTDQSSNMCEKHDCSESVLKKVKKSKKKLKDSVRPLSKDVDTYQSSKILEEHTLEDYVPKKKKKRKNKDVNIE